MTPLPLPIKTWHQYGEIIGHWDKSQMIAYGQACANDARKEFIEMQNELHRYKEREKTMGFNQN
jgi:hypothetical protein